MNRALEPSPDPTGESIRARDLSALDEPLHEDALAEMSRLEEAAGDPESRSGAPRPDAVLAVVDASYREITTSRPGCSAHGEDPSQPAPIRMIGFSQCESADVRTWIPYCPLASSRQKGGRRPFASEGLQPRDGLMRYRSVVVENEEHSLARLRRLLTQFPQEVEIVGEAADGPAAVTAIRSLAPDLVFLDIDLPGLNGFQVLERLDRQPVVIFTTAFNEHALQAFRTHAVDYLLKPIDADSLRRALEKLRAIGNNPGQLSHAIQQLLESSGTKYLTRFSCKVGDRTILLKTGEILYFQADNKYTSVHTANREFLIDTPLIELEGQLDPKDFVRIHRSTLVNISWIAEIRRWYDGKLKVLLRDPSGTELIASRTYADNLRKL
jgi:two-component system, LytTR family, response regulator